MSRKIDSKAVVIEKEITLKDAACYHYPCSRCGKTELLPMLWADYEGMDAPPGWCCVIQDWHKSYYCHDCSVEIGIGA